MDASKKLITWFVSTLKKIDFSKGIDLYFKQMLHKTVPDSYFLNYFNVIFTIQVLR